MKALSERELADLPLEQRVVELDRLMREWATAAGEATAALAKAEASAKMGWQQAEYFAKHAKRSDEERDATRKMLIEVCDDHKTAERKIGSSWRVCPCVYCAGLREAAGLKVDGRDGRNGTDDVGDGGENW